MRNVLIFTLHKSASMFLHDLARSVAQEFGIDHHSDNYPHMCSQIEKLGWHGYLEDGKRMGCFGPIRGKSQRSIPGSLDAYSIILHLRDPRDVLVSLYFSKVYSHSRNGAGFNLSDSERRSYEINGIDHFVIERVDDFKARYQSLTSALLGKQNVVLLKYEEMISDYSGWLRRFLSAFAHLKIPPRWASVLLGERNSLEAIHKRLYHRFKDEFNVKSENIYSNKRQVKAGDHKRRLRADTIERLNAEFRTVLDVLGYERCEKLAG